MVGVWERERDITFSEMGAIQSEWSPSFYLHILFLWLVLLSTVLWSWVSLYHSSIRHRDGSGAKEKMFLWVWCHIHLDISFAVELGS
jgi:hypothetical protein